MWPWAAIVTGAAAVVLGVGGTAIGALVTGRAQNEQARRADKRQVYANVLASCEKLIEPIREYDASNPQSESALKAANFALFVALLDLKLIASDKVKSRAEALDEYFRPWIDHSATDPLPRRVEPSEYIERRTALLNAMRADLD